MNAIVSNLQQHLSSFWMERSARERKQIGWALAVIVCGLVYMLLIGPALNGRAQLEKSLPELRLQAAELQNMAREAASLSAMTATPAAPLTKEIIETTLGSKGIKPQSVASTGDAFRIQLTAVSFAGLVEWLDEMQKNARLTVVEANIVAQGQADIVNATLTLRQ